MEKRFNNFHSKARNIVECTFGQMKTRWRSIFLKPLELRIDNCVKVIVACCVLHNICIDEGDIMEAELVLDEQVQVDDISEECQDGENQPARDTGEGIAFRQQLLRQLALPPMDLN